jgi:uncharacterized protein involved in exopolysaccharide biosynthesis
MTSTVDPSYKRPPAATRWTVVLGVPLAAAVITYAGSFLIPPRYTAMTVFLPPQQQQSSASMALQSIGMLAGLSGGGLGLKNPVDQFVSMLQSTSIRGRLLDRFDLMKVYDEDLREDASKELLRRTRVSGGKDGLITIEVEDTDQKRAADLANAYVDELKGLLSQLALTDAQRQRAFLEQQLGKVKEALSRAEASLQQSGVGEGALKVSPDAAVAQLAEVHGRVAAAEVQLQTLRSVMTENAPEVQQLKESLAALKAQRSSLNRADTKSGDAGYIARVREFKYQETLFELLSKQFELAKVDEAREGTTVQVIDRASPPERRSSPKRMTLAGIAFAVALVGTLLWRRRVQATHAG